jgi:NAD kinase
MQGLPFAEAPPRATPANSVADPRKPEAMSNKSASRFAFISSDTPDARTALESLSKRYGQTPLEEADIVVGLGGDGFLLQALRDSMGTG